MSNNLKVINTEDGSSSVHHVELNENYHSMHGAVQESVHVYIKKGLNYWLSKNSGAPIRIFEVGMGTGLNVLLTLKTHLEIGFPVKYVAVEPFPLTAELVGQLNYAKEFNNQLLQEIFEKIHSDPWNAAVPLVPGFDLLKIKEELQDFVSANTFDLIYFDAFAPNKQPELWEMPLLQKTFDLLDKGGVLVTYCAKGQFKRDLRAVGFEVDTLEGPPGKFEMVRGIKKS